MLGPTTSHLSWREPRLSAFAYVAASIDGIVQHIHLGDAAAVRFERAAPVRSFPAWPHKRSYDGSYWSMTTGGHVGFESLYEKTALMMLDRDPSVVGISSQPMWLFWPKGSSVRSHAPDFFVRLRSGEGVVVDVRPADRLDERAAETFAATGDLCEEMGFGYRVMSDLKGVLARNLLFLSRYRGEEFRPPAELEFLDAAITRLTVEELVARFPADKALALGWIYWLVWHGEVVIDLDSPLTLTSEVTARP